MTEVPAIAVAEAPEPPEGWPGRLLSPIAGVRRGEAASALLMALTMSLVPGGDYPLKMAREVFSLGAQEIDRAEL
jgi:hypothetical protein